MAGDDGIFNVYMALRSSLVRVVMRLVPPRDVEDIVQETYVRVCRIDTAGRDLEESRAFMYKTARNLALDYLKRAENRLVVSSEDVAGDSWETLADETFEKVASDEEFSRFCKAVRSLPVQCRRVFVLKKVYGYSQREIAGKINLSENTVEKHVATGIKRCTYFMQQYEKGGRKAGEEKRKQLARGATVNARGNLND